MSFPTPTFTPWFPWRFIDGGTPADLDAKLRKVGCYLLARFDGEPPAGPADPASPSVFYIGETHGVSGSLWVRLGAFGNSAGFYGDQWNGHYAAWQYPHRIEHVIRGPGRDGNGHHTSSEHVYVAVCPVPEGLPAHLHGLFPTAVEQQALWLHAVANAGIPKLNNTGRRVPRSVPAMPDLAEADLAALLAWSTNRDLGAAAACRVAQTIARAMRYDGRLKTNAVSYGAWHGAERKLEDATWLYLGWNEHERTAVTLSVYHHDTPIHDGGAARTRDELRAMLQAFWEAWHA